LILVKPVRACEVAALFLYRASCEAGFVTGATIAIKGGQLLR
jgi:NAD(P)-dependent dehydrogenase (short-subunit alcohol dehydrogenase family)